ncbi:MAG: KpsF/GutQ family sugar-phosphate isomerase [Candidatus Eisenbacteria bacterium]|nr:KpsF/GutQ family sugar-phosphate isomerase [Candidatus Eisenbacteria bacterium]
MAGDAKGAAVSHDPLVRAREVVRIEAEAVAALEQRLGTSFTDAVRIIAECRGKLVVAGVGKSGLLGQKLAATLTSTGTPAVFLHPADALHGDAGLFTRGDVALFLSKSGATEELLALMPYLERYGIPLVSIVAQSGSPLAAKSAAAIVLGPVTEACPMDLTPTTSITLTQVVGDCLAIALMEQRGFKPEDFRFLHPGGVIGRSAARRVSELMHAEAACPRVALGTKLRDVMLEIMDKRLGITTVTNADGTLAGVVSDGDFKRILLKHADPWALTAGDVMTRTPTTIPPDELVARAVRLMEDRPQGPITALVVLDEAGRALGILHLHDCLRAG